MAISTYDELQTAAANWVNRTDLADRIPEFITLAEARLNRVLRARRAESTASLTATSSSRTIALPSAYTEALACWIVPTGSTERTELKFTDPALLLVSTETGQPALWTIDGATLAFERPCDAAYAVTLRYLAAFALSDDVPTNALLTQYPDVYLAATMCEAGAYLFDDEMVGRWEGKLARAVGQINAKEARSRSQTRLAGEFASVQRAARGGGYNVFSDR